MCVYPTVECCLPHDRRERRTATLRKRGAETVLFTVSAEVAQAAIAQVASCGACNPRADWPFEAVLDRVIQFSGVHTDYIMLEAPACPRCKATVTEKTFVEWEGGIEVNVDAGKDSTRQI